MEAVRKATSGDAQALAELSSQLRDHLLSHRGGSLLMAEGRLPSAGAFDPEQLAASMVDPDRSVLVGTIDGVVVGMALGRIETLRGDTRLGQLEGCYVESDARSVGVGRLLVDTLMAWFEECRCIGVDGVALPGDREGKSFFEAAGFKARLLVMHRSLEGGP